MGVKVMSFNLRTDTTVDGINHFFKRTHRVAEAIRKENPDLIGFQEGKDSMRKWVRDEFPEYYVLGCGREKNYYGESTFVAVRKDMFEIVSLDDFWLSSTPSLPGSRFGVDQSSCPRITTCVRLIAPELKSPFWFYNTHLDHKGSTARLLGSSGLMTDISNRTNGEKYVLTGDFNAYPGTPEIEFITKSGAKDLTENLDGTFHDFGRRETKSKIDYIFTTADGNCEDSYVVEDVPVDGVYISDHNPVVAFIEVE